jgi:hypothetical protein
VLNGILADVTNNCQSSAGCRQMQIRSPFSCRFSWWRFSASETSSQRAFVPLARAAHSASNPILARPCLGHRHDTKRRSTGSMTFRTIAHMTPVRLVVWTRSDPCRSHKYGCTCRLLPELVGWVEPKAKPIEPADDGFRCRSTHPTGSDFRSAKALFVPWLKRGIVPSIACT